jgi:flotillin
MTLFPFLILIGVGLVLAFPVIAIIASFMFRVVVATNMVHIVQSQKKTISYGTGQEAGNSYYRWPSWIPFIGVSTIELPVSNFDLSFKDYESYDKDRVPFVLDITAFFRIADTNKAAQRVSTIGELREQLKAIIQGAVRKILASHDINAIMTDRATFGNQFTEEVKGELANWGVEPVKSIELMDMRDTKNSTVIADIMAKKSSAITSASRIEVAKNNQEAQVAEIAAQQLVDMKRQETEEAVGKRTAQKEQEVGIALQVSTQKVKEEEQKTVATEMAVENTRVTKAAQNAKDAAVIAAAQLAEVLEKEAGGKLAATKLDALGIEAEGKAKGEAEKALLLAPIQAQIDLAKEIGQNPNYQNYLVMLKFVEAYQAVGIEQAKGLESADVKIIANSGNVQNGVKSALDLFSTNGGTAFAGMLEALSNSPQGKQLLESFKGLLSPNKGEAAANPEDKKDKSEGETKA